MNTGDEIRNSLGRFHLARNRNYKYVDFHQSKIIPALEAVERGNIKRLMINMPPRHGKTEIATISFIPWWLGKHPAGNAMVASYGFDLAKTFGSKVKELMQRELYTKIFPEARVSKTVHARNFLSTVSGGSFYAMGFDGAMSGRGVSLAVLDDAIKNHDEANSEARIYESTIKARLEPTPDGREPAVVIAMTRWVIRDFCGRVLEKEGKIEDGGEWTVLRLAAEPEPGKYLWGDRYSERYENARADEDTWAAVYQQDPAASKSFKFKAQWLNFYGIAPKVGKFKAYLFCDPGASKSRTSDFTEIQDYCAAQDRKLLLVDWVHDRLNVGERQKALERLIRKWNPELNLYEEYGLVNDTVYFNQQAEETGFEAILTPVGKRGERHNLSKEHRIGELTGWFEKGRIVLPQRFDYEMANGDKIDLTKRFINEEYSLYRGKGSIPHEDCLDAMSRINDVEPPYGPGFDWYIPENERPKPRVRGHAGSWQSLY
jgi:hypothetical protein